MANNRIKSKDDNDDRNRDMKSRYDNDERNVEINRDDKA